MPVAAVYGLSVLFDSAVPLWALAAVSRPVFVIEKSLYSFIMVCRVLALATL